MKLPALPALLLGFSSLPAAPPSPPARAVMPLRGLISVWTQDCPKDCGLPAAVVKNEPVQLDLSLPEKPGEFRSLRVEREYPVSDGTLKVKADFYALCPPGAAAEGCPGRYFSVQVELSGAAAALCTASFNAADFSPFPVLACGAPQGSRRLGATLHRAPLP